MTIPKWHDTEEEERSSDAETAGYDEERTGDYWEHVKPREPSPTRKQKLECESLRAPIYSVNKTPQCRRPIRTTGHHQSEKNVHLLMRNPPQSQISLSEVKPTLNLLSGSRVCPFPVNLSSLTHTFNQAQQHLRRLAMPMNASRCSFLDLNSISEQNL